MAKEVLNAGNPGRSTSQLASDSSNATIVSPEECSGNLLAMVPYCGENLKEITNSLKGLGLKRGAEEELERPKQKRSRPSEMKSNCLGYYTVYAGNLRKTKARLKRQGKRKGRMERENIPMEILEWEEEMVDPVSPNGDVHGFVFKARGGRQKDMEAEGDVGSDHHALIIDCCYCEDKAPKSFKFEANWAQHADFLSIVSNSWNEDAGSAENCLFELIQRLDVCRQRLMEWSRKEFPNFRKVIDQLRRQLCCCYEGFLTDSKLKEAESLVRQIEEAWVKEETYWWQISRVAWLKCGDRNTKFFHSSVIQRRLRNKILRLKSDSSIWLEDRAAINKSFSDFYKSLFGSVGSRPLDQALSYVTKMVTDEDNIW
ncbi:hypothetical protein K1719_006533 [Acacia pycnantha]|nr:hypothetical protein K1719_006533 [Acacia pycnantha]